MVDKWEMSSFLMKDIDIDVWMDAINARININAVPCVYI
jgi:hypothetical protein